MRGSLLVLILVALLGISIATFTEEVPNAEGEYAQCKTYSFSCCSDITYPVYNRIAHEIEKTTCDLLNYVFEGELKNASEACRQAYKAAYCVVAIPQCCSSDNYAVFTPCVSLCDTVFKECPSDYDSKVISPCNTLPSSIWFDEPCNSGTGGPCF